MSMDSSSALLSTLERPRSSSWVYAGDASQRDLRVDFMRGLAMVSVVVVHMEFFSLFNFLVWERVGVVSSAGFFVVLSGFVLGQVSRKRMDREGLRSAAWKLWERAALLYRTLLGISLFGALAALVPLWDSGVLTTFMERATGTLYVLYPEKSAGLDQWVGRWLLLRMGPYQVQILGLYTACFLMAPAALWLLGQGRWRWLLALSWVGYFSQRVSPVMPTGASFEYAFPLLTWQVYFVHGLAAGYHRGALLEFYACHRRVLLSVAVPLSVALCFVAQNSPNPFMPAYARLSVIPPETFNRWRTLYFAKENLGLLRILNIATLLILGGELLTHAWGPLQAAFGWFFIPLGQASLYVFTMHVPLVLIAANVVPFGFSTTAAPPLLFNTLAHLACLAVLWLLVRHRVLYRWIPH